MIVKKLPLRTLLVTTDKAASRPGTAKGTLGEGTAQRDEDGRAQAGTAPGLQKAGEWDPEERPTGWLPDVYECVRRQLTGFFWPGQGVRTNDKEKKKQEKGKSIKKGNVVK